MKTRLTITLLFLLVSITSFSQDYWVSDDGLGYSYGIDQAPEGAEVFDTEKEWLKAIDAQDKKTSQEIDEFFFSDLEGVEENKAAIEGVHRCYFEDSVEDIVNNKKVSNHNIAINAINEKYGINLSKSGNEKEKVSRIVEYLENIGLRKN